ncbi:hypothetical protein KEM54_001345 [Ascosphaera aggregata]|nr:hypothetical protein KEM54_001345 [Ascosphaera aggregata]
MAGVADEGINVSKLSAMGNQGLGTFHHMDGELVMLDSKVYHFHADGTVEMSPPDGIIPFAMVTNFSPQHTLENQEIEGKDALVNIVKTIAPTTDNLFVSYKLHGRWENVHVRMCVGQEYPGEGLAQVARKQVEYTYRDASGTIVGFRSPEAWQGFSVAGHHLHFLSDDGKLGGHIMQLKSRGGVKLQVSVVSDLNIELPKGKEFNVASLTVDSDEINHAEG